VENQNETNNVVERCRAGEVEAFDLLFDQYKSQVYRVALALLRHPQDAEDAVQDVFIGLLRSIRTFDPQRGVFERWLNQVVANHCRRKLRRHFLSVSLSNLWGSNDEDAVEFDLPDPSPSNLPDHVAQTNDLRRQMWVVVNKMDDKMRSVVVLRYYLDMSCAEIASTLQINEGTVHSRLHEARRRLQLTLQSDGLTEAFGFLEGNRRRQTIAQRRSAKLEVEV